MSPRWQRTQDVLAEVLHERGRQRARYGENDDLENGTGPYVRWLEPLSPAAAKYIEHDLRTSYEAHEARHGKPTWRHLVLEEVAEAFQESDPGRLREEVLQVAALCVSWLEKLAGPLPEETPKHRVRLLGTGAWNCRDCVAHGQERNEAAAMAAAEAHALHPERD